MDFSEIRLHKSEIATQQLKTAISLFLYNKDFPSVITLSSAASNILSGLVRNSGRESFVDYACRVYDALSGSIPPRMKYKHYIDNTLGVNILKHMSSHCPKTCSLDLFRCAVSSITMAIADYVTLYGQNDNIIHAFLSWSWMNEDCHQIIELYNNMPKKMKKRNGKQKIIQLDKIMNKAKPLAKKTVKKTHKRIDLAKKELETAIMLFITGQDLLSSITLAGAADVIFCQLVNREGKMNFTDLQHQKEGYERSRSEIGKEVNDLLHINALKHYDKGDEEFVQINIAECALGTLSKAVANYNMLEGKDKILIDAFRYYVETNIDIQKYLSQNSY